MTMDLVATIQLGPTAASSCRRRIHLDHDPTATRPPRESTDPAWSLIRQEIAEHRLATLAMADVPGALRSQRLSAGRRVAVIDLLIPHDGGYVPILVKGHRTLDAGSGAVLSRLGDPMDRAPSDQFKMRSRTDDAMSLAHCRRILQDLGMASDEAVGGIIGRGNADDQLICWYQLDGAPSSVVAEYDARFADRIAVADAAAHGDPALAVPSRVSECRRCPWNDRCTVEMTLTRDVSLIAAGSDATSLRAAGVLTIDDLAAADDEQLGTVAASRSTGLARGPELRDRARTWLHGAVLARKNAAVRVPRADIELDVDMECYMDDGAYLWGTYLSGTPAGVAAAHDSGFDTGYQPFATWETLPGRAEGVMFAEFWAYLRELQLVANEAGLTFAAYCYSRQAEERWLFSTPARFPDVPGMPSADQVRRFTSSGSWVDMYEMLSREFLAAGSKRLKTVAPVAGFHWRDAEPDGANSMVWYRDAVGADGGPADETQRIRLLEYNEDDVRATRALRRWMTANAPGTPTLHELAAEHRPTRPIGHRTTTMVTAQHVSSANPVAT